MNLESIDVIFEACRTVAVVLTLVTVARQLQRESREVRANTANAVMSSLQNGFEASFGIGFQEHVDREVIAHVSGPGDQSPAF